MSMLNIAFTITTAPLLPAHLAKDDVLAVEVVGARRRDEELPRTIFSFQFTGYGRIFRFCSLHRPAVEVVGARRRDEELPQKTALQLSAHGLR